MYLLGVTNQSTTPCSTQSPLWSAPHLGGMTFRDAVLQMSQTLKMLTAGGCVLTVFPTGGQQVLPWSRSGWHPGWHILTTAECQTPYQAAKKRPRTFLPWPYLQSSKGGRCYSRSPMTPGKVTSGGRCCQEEVHIIERICSPEDAWFRERGQLLEGSFSWCLLFSSSFIWVLTPGKIEKLQR